MNTRQAREIMDDFAERTGLVSPKVTPRRYLWTDAHAVCNFLSLYRQSGEQHYIALAISLIDQVHNVLGKHRDDDPRNGWISGLTESEGIAHPTAGGLRIGKKLNERKRDAGFDERLEWDRDGQYFHYLTKWMHALCRAGSVSGDSRYVRWAVELAEVAHAGFIAATAPGQGQRLHWKMSIDLSYPLVFSSGQHDALDAYVTYNELACCATTTSDKPQNPELSAEIEDAVAMIKGRHWHTDDPLGLGGLLFDAGRLVQLLARTQMLPESIAESILRDSIESFGTLARKMPLDRPADQRLAFRELGLSIGLQAIATIRPLLDVNPGLFAPALRRDVDYLERFLPLRATIENFWSETGNQRVASWLDHLDINRVMLATSLLPEEFLAV